MSVYDVQQRSQGFERGRAVGGGDGCFAAVGSIRILGLLL